MTAASSGAKDYSSANTLVSKVYSVMERTLPRTARNWARKQFFTPLKIKFRKSELEFLETATKSMFPFEDKKIAVYEWGKGPTVLMQHGWAGKGIQFIEFVKKLVEAGYHVVVSDAPAHGNSSGSWTSAFEIVGLIKALKSKYGEIHSFIGHSMGGLVLMNVMAEGVKLNRVVIISTPTKGKAVMDAFLRIIGGSIQTGEFIKDFIRKKYGREFESLFVPNIDPEWTRDMLVIHDKKDRQVSMENIEVTKQLLPFAEYHFTEGLGHTRILYDKDVVDLVLSKLSK